MCTPRSAIFKAEIIMKKSGVIEKHSDKDVEDVLESSFFDPNYYAQLAGLDDSDRAYLARHYLDVGWHLNFDPSNSFSSVGYLRTHSDVALAKINPLLHYLRCGYLEKREIITQKSVVVSPFTVPSETDWNDLQLSGGIVAPNPVVDVIVPVYLGYNETINCLFSVLASPQLTSFRLLVMNDCSPDPALSLMLENLAERGFIKLYSSIKNLGFVATCNRGMAEHPDRDVVLLNSDTEVYNDWLDRLYTTAYSASNIATVTPLSNNAEICSYPNFIQDNFMCLELSDQELDTIAARVNAGKTVDIPTGVGFCMFIRRKCLDIIGLLDVERFGRGYGEENDLCLRAAAAGWRNLLAGDIFVRHYGGISFGSEKLQRISAALKIIAKKYPDYLSSVRRFIKADVPREIRTALDKARLAHRSVNGAILFVTHSWGGGTEQHVRDMSELMEASGVAVFFCRIAKDAPEYLEISDSICTILPNLPRFKMSDGPEALAEFVNSINVRHIHIQHLAGLGTIAPDFFRSLARLAGVPYDVTLHDYMAVCPRINMIDFTGVYCTEPSESICNLCLKNDGSPFGHQIIEVWRERYQRLLSEARLVFVPNEDVAIRMRRYFSDIQFEVREHTVPTYTSVTKKQITPQQKRRRIALLGALGPHKGSALLERVASHAYTNNLPLDFVVVGYTDRDLALRAIGNVEITGRYEEENAVSALNAIHPDLVWFSAVCPETFSYTLSMAFEAGVFPVVFDLGAPALRIRAAGWGGILPIMTMLSPEKICQALIEQPIDPMPSDFFVKNTRVQYNDPLRTYYGLARENFM
jgi:O-antigen biosynthesis protein